MEKKKGLKGFTTHYNWTRVASLFLSPSLAPPPPRPQGWGHGERGVGGITSASFGHLQADFELVFQNPAGTEKRLHVRGLVGGAKVLQRSPMSFMCRQTFYLNVKLKES